MRRASNAMPPELWGMWHNPNTGLYEIKENDITYSMQIECTRLLRDYYRIFAPGAGMDRPTVANWFKDLDNQTKKQVIRIGNIPKETKDFFPDPEFE